MKWIMYALCFISYVAWSPLAYAKDGIDVTDTNLIGLATSKSDLVAHIYVKSVDFVRKPRDPNVAELYIYGRLTTLQVKKVYHWTGNSTTNPTTVYLYQSGAVGGSFLEPTLRAGEECIAFLTHASAPVILNTDVVTDPNLPDDNYFSFSVLPQRSASGGKAYIPEAGSNTIVTLDAYFANSVVGVSPEERAEGSDLDNR